MDHCEQYKAPNADMSKVDELTAAIRMEGCAPQLPLLPIKTEVLVKQVQSNIISILIMIILMNLFTLKIIQICPS